MTRTRLPSWLPQDCGPARESDSGRLRLVRVCLRVASGSVAEIGDVRLRFSGQPEPESEPHDAPGPGHWQSRPAPGPETGRPAPETVTVAFAVRQPS